jgi:hypothetical protein
LFIGAATVGPFCHEQHLFSAAKLLKNYILSSTKALEPIALRAQHCHRWRIAQTGHARGCFCRSNCVSGSVRRGLSRFNSARHQFPAPLPSALRKLQAWEWYWFSDVVRRCFGRRSNISSSIFPEAESSVHVRRGHTATCCSQSHHPSPALLLQCAHHWGWIALPLDGRDSFVSTGK